MVAYRLARVSEPCCKQDEGTYSLSKQWEKSSRRQSGPLQWANMLRRGLLRSPRRLVKKAVGATGCYERNCICMPCVAQSKQASAASLSLAAWEIQCQGRPWLRKAGVPCRDVIARSTSVAARFLCGDGCARTARAQVYRL